MQHLEGRSQRHCLRVYFINRQLSVRLNGDLSQWLLASAAVIDCGSYCDKCRHVLFICQRSQKDWFGLDRLPPFSNSTVISDRLFNPIIDIVPTIIITFQVIRLVLTSQGLKGIANKMDPQHDDIDDLLNTINAQNSDSDDSDASGEAFKILKFLSVILCI